MGNSCNFTCIEIRTVLNENGVEIPIIIDYVSPMEIVYNKSLGRVGRVMTVERDHPLFSYLLPLCQVLVGTRSCFELLRRDEPSVKVFTLPQGSGGAVSAIQVTQRQHVAVLRLRDDDLTREAQFPLPFLCAKMGQLKFPNFGLS